MDFAYITPQEVPHTLYHYTSLEALVSIVHSKRLRASDIRYLNDTSEASQLTKDVISILRARALSEQDQEVISLIIDTLEQNRVLSLFVASFSEDGDLLSQWRAYSPPSLGVSIGFSRESLSEQWVANPRGEKPYFLSCPLQQVRYYDSTQQDDLWRVHAI